MDFPIRATRYVWRRTAKPAVAAMKSAGRVARNSAMRCLVRADYQRWSSPQGLEQWWDERTQRLAALIPAGSRLIEFGAGRRSLEKFLPSECIYTPSDLIDRGPGTLVCNLNDRPLPDLKPINPQVAVFSGVLEYIKDVPALIEWLADSGIECCVTSYESVPADFRGLRRLREHWRRSHNGYMSSLHETELIFAFERTGLALDQKQSWTTQGVYRFCKRNSK